MKGTMGSMNLFRYETHLHTRESSACGKLSGAEQARVYKDAGYAGIIVTDHFFNGNCNVRADLSWEDRVDSFCLGYENARKEGKRIGLSVFFGWEANFQGTEFLIYGLDQRWLRNHPDILTWSIEEQYQKVHDAGGFVVHAHPFRMRSYIKKIRLFPNAVDAVEAVNMGNWNNTFDKKAADYARNNNLPMTAGTDSHGIEEMRTGVAFYRPLKDSRDYMKEILSGRYQMIDALPVINPEIMQHRK